MTTDNPTTLPPAVATYFDLMDQGRRPEVINLFTPDACVVDDGHTYVGLAEISGWLAGAASEYTTTSTRLTVESRPPLVSALVRVEGNFPGGRVDLVHEFRLDPAGSIAALRIAV